MPIERSTCNPLEIWPARTHKKLRVRKSTSKGGWTDKRTANIPAENNAYARTVRLHEAAHSLYSDKLRMHDDVIGQAVEDARIHTILHTQGSAARDEMATALMDLHKSPRMHLSRAGIVTAALRSGAILAKHVGMHKSGHSDLLTDMCMRIGPQFTKAVGDALALLRDGDQVEKAEAVIRKAVTADTKPKPKPKPDEPKPDMPGARSKSPMAPEAKPQPKEDEPKGPSEVDEDEAKDNPGSDLDEPLDGPEDSDSEADASGVPMDEDSEPEDDANFDPFAGESKDTGFGKAKDMLKGKDAKKVVYSEPTLEEVKGALSAEAVEMLSERTQQMVEDEEDKGRLPTVNIVPIFKADPIRAKVGSTARHSISGQRIDSKKLSLVVTPGEHRIFLKTQRSNGGTILIDASGSMQMTLQDLEGILLEAPVATIAFYNAYADYKKSGNLWIFAYRGKRAPQIEGPGLPLEDKERTTTIRKLHPNDKYATYTITYEDKSVAEHKRWGRGNVIDFQVCQWLLAQPGPRYFVTDQEFCGSSSVSNVAAMELTENAEKAGKLRTVWSPKHRENCHHTFALLRKILSEQRGR